MDVNHQLTGGRRLPAVPLLYKKIRSFMEADWRLSMKLAAVELFLQVPSAQHAQTVLLFFRERLITDLRHGLFHQKKL